MVPRSLLAGVSAVLLAATCTFAQNVPSGAKYTILLRSYSQPEHIAVSKQELEIFRRATGLKDFQLIHSEGESILYYGYYRAIDRSVNEDEAQRYRGDLNKLTGLTLEGGLPFRAAYGTILPTPEPQAPAEWNILNAKGKYSLEIALFKVGKDFDGNPKQVAVDFVKELRKQDVPAYYYHSPSASHVLVGCFQPEAITIIGGDVKADKDDHEVVVLPFKTADMGDEVQQADGTTSKVVAPSVRINDPLLLGLLRREEFQHHIVNNVVGRLVTDPRTGKKNEIFDQSIIVDISKIKDDLAASHVKREPAASPDLIIPQPSTPGGGLRKVGG